MAIRHLPLYPIVAAVFGITQLEARLSHAALKNEKLLYRFSRLFRALIIFGVITLSFFCYRDWATTEWWIRIGLIGFDLWFLLSWPPVIAISNRGLERLWWWRAKVFIPWSEVVDAEQNKDGDITVIGMEGRIEFSRFQNDPLGFEKEVLKRSKLRKFNKPELVQGLHLQ
jgi:hypothetical protein